MAALDFFKEQTKGPINKIFLAGYLRDLTTAEDKWKAIMRLVRDFALFRITWPLALAGLFGAMGKTIRTILHDTGSLDAALRRLSSIQGFQRQFAPLLGGLNAAKQRVAELVQFSARNRIFSFEDIGEASHRLEVFTRGAFSGNDALSAIHLSAIQSRNGIVDVADAVGHFYDDLREGRPVDNAAESLRQMGVVSQETARRLTQLQSTGADVQQVMGDLMSTLAGGQVQPGGLDPALVQRQHAEAGERLKEAFGAPFTRDDIQNTKNYTDAMTAIAPTVGRVAGFFAILTNGLSTVRSWFAKTAAESPVLQRAFEFTAKAIGLVVTAAAVVAAVKIPMVFAGWAAAIAGVGRAAVIARGLLLGLSVASGIIAAIAVIGTAIGVIINYQRAQAEAARVVRELAQAHSEAQAAIDAQALSIQTLADRNELLAKSMQQIIDLEQKLAELRSGAVKPSSARKAQEEEIARALAEAKAKQAAIIAAGGEGLTGPAQEAFIAAQVERTQQLRRGAYQAAITRQAPEGRVEIMRRREADLAEDQRQAEQGLEAAKDVERVRAKRQTELLAAQQSQKEADVELRRRQALFPEGGTNEESRRILGEGKAAKEAADREVLKRQRAVAAVGLAAPRESSVFADAMAEAIRNSIAAAAAEAKGDKTLAARFRALAGGVAGTPQDVANWQMYAEQQRRKEQNLPAISAELQQGTAERERLERELNIARTQEDLQIRAHEIRRRGDTRRSTQLEDEIAFGQRYQQNIEAGMSQQEAFQRALRVTADTITETANYRGVPQIADSLARIGGGGGVYAPGTDPMLRIAERQRSLMEEARDYLKQIADKDGGVD